MRRGLNRTAWQAVVCSGVIGLACGVAIGKVAYPPLDLLLVTSQTIIGQPIAYPEGTAQVTAAIVTMAPGQETGWHRHEAPLFAYLLEGELTVDYGPAGTRTYRQGDAFVEALQSRHDGTNTGSTETRILAVFVGAAGVANTVED